MMTLPQVISRNQVQKTNKRVLPWSTDVIQPTTWYTCPTGKIAIVKGIVTCQNTGAAANASLEIAGIQLARWEATGGTTVLQTPIGLAENTVYPFEADLDPGDAIITTQDSGTNAEFKLQAVIEEFNI